MMWIRFSLLVSLSLFAAQCVSKGGSGESKQDAESQVAKLAQAQFQKIFESNANAKEAWALYSGGGLAGVGKHGSMMVVGNDPHAELFFIPLGKKDVVRNSLAKDLKFAETISKLSEGLTDHWENGFDMFEEEYVHMVKDADNKLSMQRLRWRCGRNPCKRYHALETAFEALQK